MWYKRIGAWTINAVLTLPQHSYVCNPAIFFKKYKDAFEQNVHYHNYNTQKKIESTCSTLQYGSLYEKYGEYGY
jgi:hypothetical protein